MKKGNIKKFTAIILACAVLCVCTSSAAAIGAGENETPILPIDGEVLPVLDENARAKLPEDLISAMENADDDELIGFNGTFGKTSSLVMHIDVPNGRPDVAYWFEYDYVGDILERHKVKFERIDRTGETGYFRDSDDVPFQSNADTPVPKMPDGSDFLRPFIYGEVWDLYGYEEYINRGFVNLSLTKSEILALCEDKAVICFEYGEEADLYNYETQFVSYTSDDALTLLRASIETYRLKARFYDLDEDWKCTSNDALEALRASVYDHTVMFSLRQSEEWTPDPPTETYAVHFDSKRAGSAKAIVNDSDLVISGHVSGIDFELMGSGMEGLKGDLKNDLPETNSAYVHLLTNYYLSDVKELSNKGFDLPQDGSLSFSVYGGRGRYADEEPYIEKQAAAAGEYKIVPYLFNGITSPDHDRIKLGGDYIFLLKYDEGSARFTLRDVTHSVYSTDPGYTDSAGISAKTVEAACKDLSNG